jgi:nitrate reductase gamma subunit
MRRAAAFSRRIVDPANSVAWYAMDGLWLAQLTWPAYVAAGLTLATGGTLLFLNRRTGQRLNDDLALNAWMWMNALWVISDLGRLPQLRFAAMAVGVLGAVLLANALRPSRRRRNTLRRFRKMRVGGR